MKGTSFPGKKCAKGQNHQQRCEPTTSDVPDDESVQNPPLEDSTLGCAATDGSMLTTASDDSQSAACFVLELPGQRVRDKKVARTSYFCDFPDCHKKFLSYHSLKSHAMVHSGVRPYACQWADCGRTFTSFYSMSAHCRTHTGQRPYTCAAQGCQKAFKSSSDLRRHSRTHTGDKPYACSFRGCFKRFSTLDIRKVHLRTHTGERPYVCDVPNCLKAFSSQTNCKNHMRTHTGEKPFACKHPGCGKSFTEYSTMYKHQMVHLQSSIVCDVCNKTFRHMGTFQSHRQREHSWLPADASEGEKKGEQSASGAASPQRIQLLLTELDVRTVEINGETAQVLVLPPNGDQQQESADSADLHLLGCAEALVVEADDPANMVVEGDVPTGVVVEDLSVEMVAKGGVAASLLTETDSQPVAAVDEALVEGGAARSGTGERGHLASETVTAAALAPEMAGDADLSLEMSADDPELGEVGLSVVVEGHT